MRYYRLVPPRPGDAVDAPDPASGAARTRFVWVYPSRDPIVKDGTFFGVTEPFAARLRRSALGGYRLAPTETSSPPGMPLVPILRLVVDGRAGVDDFGLQTPVTLIVSERVLDEIRAHGATECELHDYDPGYRVPTPEELMQQLKDRRRQ